ncbi:MAG: hypothetical protein LBE74_04580 [Treponema sp.]|jgi:hypothetical protein|nr:hypothetical protein [Treponema sp.]
MNEKGLITIAIGKKYAVQAKYLALSAMLNSPQTVRAVITDNPKALGDFFDVIVPYDSALGNPFETKTRLNLYTPFEKTLFLDADSLVVHSLDSYWESLDKRRFVYAGDIVSSGVWYVDVEKAMARFGLTWLPKFNSGMFLFDKSEEASRVFNAAFALMRNGLDVDFFRAKMLPDEPFLAISLAQNNAPPFEDYGRFSRTLIDAKRIRLNVVKRTAFFIKRDKPVFPLVVHLCGRFGAVLFFREKIRLFLRFNPPLTVLYANILTLFRFFVKLFSKTKN